MKKIISSTILSFVLIAMLFLLFDLYTIGDIPTRLVVIRYIVSSIVGAIYIILFRLFIKNNKNNTPKLLSVLTLIPLILNITLSILRTILESDNPANNPSILSLLIIIMHLALPIPCIFINAYSLKNSKDKSTKVISIISLVLWILIILLIIRILMAFKGNI